MNFYLDAADRFTATVDATDRLVRRPARARAGPPPTSSTTWSTPSASSWPATAPSSATGRRARRRRCGRRTSPPYDRCVTDGLPRREYDGFFGRTTIGATLDNFYGFDLVVHGWDLGLRHRTADHLHRRRHGRDGRRRSSASATTRTTTGSSRSRVDVADGRRPARTRLLAADGARGLR